MTKPTGRPRGRPSTAVEPCEAFGEERMLEMIAVDGAYLKQVAAAIGITRFMLAGWIRKDPARARRFAEAEKDAAEAAAARARQVLEELPANATNAQIARAKELSNKLCWEAEMRDRSRFGKQQLLTIAEQASDMDDESLDREIESLLAKREAAAVAKGRLQ